MKVALENFNFYFLNLLNSQHLLRSLLTLGLLGFSNYVKQIIKIMGKVFSVLLFSVQWETFWHYGKKWFRQSGFGTMDQLEGKQSSTRLVQCPLGKKWYQLT